MKAREAGIELTVKKRDKHIEDHWDDCGEDISYLGESLDHYVLKPDTSDLHAYDFHAYHDGISDADTWAG